MTLKEEVKWSCIFLITALVVGLMLRFQPTPSIAHTIAKATVTLNCEGPSAYQRIEKPLEERAVKSEKSNADSSRNCRSQLKVQEPAANFWQSDEGRGLTEEGRLLDSNPNADACLTYEGEYIRQSKACPERV